jgi:hypothetical protein
MAEQKRGSHTVHDIKYHAVWIAKYRYEILTKKVADAVTVKPPPNAHTAAHLATPARKPKLVPLYYALRKPIANGISINPAFDSHFRILLTVSFNLRFNPSGHEPASHGRTQSKRGVLPLAKHQKQLPQRGNCSNSRSKSPILVRRFCANLAYQLS